MDLFNRIGRSISRGIKALWKAFLISIVFIVRRWLPLTISIVLGLGVSYLTMKNTSSTYSSEMVLRNNAINNSELISYINRLNELDDNSLARKLNISAEKGRNIGEIRAFWIIDKNKDEIPDYIDYTNTHDIYDTTNIRMNDRFDIRINIKENQNLGIVRDGIIWCIENDSSFRHMNRLRLRQNKEMLARYETDIRNLDSLQKVKYFEEPRGRIARTNGQIVFMQEQPAQMFYRDIQQLYEKKQKLEQETDLYKGAVTLISDFTRPSQRINGLKFYARKYIPIFLISMILILIILHNRNKLIEVYKKY
jgi:hypothetical protein